MVLRSPPNAPTSNQSFSNPSITGGSTSGTAIGATSISASIRTVNGATTISSSDFTVLGNATAAAFSITLTAAASNTGRIMSFKKVDASANNVTIQANASELIDGSNTKVISAQYSAILIQSDGTSWWII